MRRPLSFVICVLLMLAAGVARAGLCDGASPSFLMLGTATSSVAPTTYTSAIAACNAFVASQPTTGGGGNCAYAHTVHLAADETCVVQRVTSHAPNKTCGSNGGPPGTYWLTQYFTRTCDPFLSQDTDITPPAETASQPTTVDGKVNWQAPAALGQVVFWTFMVFMFFHGYSIGARSV